MRHAPLGRAAQKKIYLLKTPCGAHTAAPVILARLSLWGVGGLCVACPCGRFVNCQGLDRTWLGLGHTNVVDWADGRGEGRGGEGLYAKSIGFISKNEMFTSKNERHSSHSNISIIIAQNGDLLGTHFWHRPNVQRFFGVFFADRKTTKKTLFSGPPPKSMKSGPMSLLYKD